MKILLSLFCLILMVLVTADNQYFLCGPDEDGCYPGIYQWCMCIRKHPTLAATPYCMDFDSLSCQPATAMPQCPVADLRPTQSNCVATLFQSEPEPACPLVDESFCRDNGIQLF